MEAAAEDPADEVLAPPNKFPIMVVAVVTKLEVLFLVESSVENTWMVPWLLEATTKLVSGLQMRRVLTLTNTSSVSEE